MCDGITEESVAAKCLGGEECLSLSTRNDDSAVRDATMARMPGAPMKLFLLVQVSLPASAVGMY